MPSSDPAVLKYYLFKATSSHGFVIPIIVVYFLSRGMSYPQIGIIEASFMAGIVLWEIPTGYVGDRLGRKQSILIGSVLIGITFVGLSVSRNFPAFLAMYSLWAIGITFHSGSTDAWLYEILEDRLDESEFAGVRGRGRAIKLAVTAITTIVGAYLFTYNSYYPFLANAALLGVSVLVLYTFPASPNYEEETDDERFTIVDAIPILRKRILQSRLRLFILYTTLFSAFNAVVVTFMQPVSLDIGLGVIALGFLYAGLNLFGSAVSYFTEGIHKRVGIKTWFYTAPFAVALVFTLLSLFPLVAFPAFFLLRGVSTISGSLQGQYINDRVESIGRATTMSAVFMVWGLTAAVARVLGGVVAGAIGPVGMYVVFAIGFIFIAGGMVVFGSPVDTQEKIVGNSTD